MMTYLTKTHWLIAACIFLITISLSMSVDAGPRGGGGKGAVSRSGPAAGGSMRGRSPSIDRSSKTRPSSGNRDNRASNKRDVKSDRRDAKQDVRSDRRESKSDRREHRQDVHSERHEWAEDRYRGRRTARIVVGTSLTIASWNALTCRQTTVLVGDITYYTCDGTWYQPNYRGNSVTYVVVNTPAGY